MSKLPAVLQNLPLPIIGSPLFIISTPALVIAQCKAGVVGAMPALNARPAEQLEEWLIEITETRVQPKNRENALRLLRSMLYDKELQHRMAEQAKVEAGKKKIEWGSQIRSYVFDDRRVKDHRTNFQTSDVNGVMDGKIDGFIKAYLMEFAGSGE